MISRIPRLQENRQSPPKAKLRRPGGCPRPGPVIDSVPFDRLYESFILYFFTRKVRGRSPLTKIDIISLVSDDTGLSRVKAEEAVDAIIDAVKESLARGETVILRRFGSFSVRRKNARVGRSPKTGLEAPISARRVVSFKAGGNFKDAVNGAGVKFY